MYTKGPNPGVAPRAERAGDLGLGTQLSAKVKTQSQMEQALFTHLLTAPFCHHRQGECPPPSTPIHDKLREEHHQLNAPKQGLQGHICKGQGLTLAVFSQYKTRYMLVSRGDPCRTQMSVTPGLYRRSWNSTSGCTQACVIQSATTVRIQGKTQGL